MGEHIYAWPRKGDPQSVGYVYFVISGVFMDHSMQLSFCIDFNQIPEGIFSLVIGVGRKEQDFKANRRRFHSYSGRCHLFLGSANCIQQS